DAGARLEHTPRKSLKCLAQETTVSKSSAGRDQLQLTFFSDEVWFHLQGYIYTQNNWYWSYVQVILKQFFPALTEDFQQDSATAPTAHKSMQALSDDFRDRIIGSGIWPAHSPYLNPRDFFFWGCLKDKVHNSYSKMEKLKENICREIANIPAEQLQMLNLNVFCWCEECLHVDR
ncbi:hypothetical protein B7P43_G15516, partial [Cryptotermes secundus]